MLNAINLIASISILAPALVGAIVFFKLSNTLKTLATFVFVGVCFEIVVFSFAKCRINNLFLFHIYTFFEFGALSFFFFQLARSQFLKIFILSGIAVFVGFSIYEYTYGLRLSEFNSFQRIVENLLLLIFILAAFAEMSLSKVPIFIEYSPYFIVVVGLLLYVLGTTLLYVFSHYMIARHANSYWILHGVFRTTFNLSIAFALWKGRFELKR